MSHWKSWGLTQRLTLPHLICRKMKKKRGAKEEMTDVRKHELRIQKSGDTKPVHLNQKQPTTEQISPHCQGLRDLNTHSIPEATPCITTPSFNLLVTTPH